VRILPLVVGAFAVVALWAHRSDVADVTGPLRILGLVLALAGGFVLDDAAATTLQASPYSLARRHRLRIGCGATVIAALWGIALLRLLPYAPAGQRVTLGLGLTEELAAALAVVWAAGAWLRRRGLDEPGIATGPVLLGLSFVSAAQQRFPMLAGPGANWLSAHLRWTAVLIGAVVCLVYAMRDPAG
jgi:hypothetical protein